MSKAHNLLYVNNQGVEFIKKTPWSVSSLEEAQSSPGNSHSRKAFIKLQLQIQLPNAEAVEASQK